MAASCSLSLNGLPSYVPPTPFWNKSMAEQSSEFYELEEEIIAPLGRNRIFILGKPPISASHCLGNTMILSQSPENSNFDTFLSIIYSQVDAVIMLAQDSQYETYPSFVWYINPQKIFQGDFFTVGRKDIRSSQRIDESTLEVSKNTDKSSVKSVPHYHYKHWVDGTGTDPKDIADLARIAMRANKPLIHCMMGEGRAGTLAAVISAYQRVRAGNSFPDMIYNSVRELRKERPRSVHSLAQYKNIYDAVYTLLLEDDLVPPTHQLV